MRAFSIAVVVLGLMLMMGVFAVKAAPREFSVEMKNVRFSLSEIRVDWGDEVTIHVHNNDTAVPAGHTFELVEYDVHLGTTGSPLPPGAEDNAAFTANLNGTFWYFCSVPGHATRLADGSWSGMAGRLIVGAETADDSGLDLIIIVGGIAAVAVVAVVGVYLLRRRQ